MQDVNSAIVRCLDLYGTARGWKRNMVLPGSLDPSVMQDG